MMNHISISQKVELIKEHKKLLVDLLEDEIKEKEGHIYRYAKDNSELQAIVNNF